MQYDMESIQIFSELVSRAAACRVICIHGKSGSGKSTTAIQLAKALGYPLFHTDAYQHYGWDQSLYQLLNDLNERTRTECIVEGVQVPRLIRKGFRVDLIVETVCSDDTRVKRYEQRGHGKKVGNLGKFDLTLARIWAECIVTCPQLRYSTENLDTGI